MNYVQRKILKGHFQVNQFSCQHHHLKTKVLALRIISARLPLRLFSLEDGEKKGKNFHSCASCQLHYSILFCNGHFHKFLNLCKTTYIWHSCDIYSFDCSPSLEIWGVFYDIYKAFMKFGKMLYYTNSNLIAHIMVYLNFLRAIRQTDTKELYSMEKPRSRIKLTQRFPQNLY